jgi:hypothetical protein
LDEYELNMLGAKRERADELLRAGLLVDEWEPWQPDPGLRTTVVDHWQTRPFARPFAARTGAALDSDYADALAAFAVWHSPTEPAARRVAALEFACRSLEEICAKKPTYARLSTFARAAGDAGRREQSVEALKQLVIGAAGETVRITEPFWPAWSRYDELTPSGDLDQWFAASALEQLERTASHSSVFGGCSKLLHWMCRREFASTAMERRQALIAARRGELVSVPHKLRHPAPDHRNAPVWAQGRVPNTVLAD